MMNGEEARKEEAARWKRNASNRKFRARWFLVRWHFDICDVSLISATILNGFLLLFYWEIYDLIFIDYLTH